MSFYVIDDHPMMRQAIAMLLRRVFSSTNVVEIGKLSEFAAATIKHGDPKFILLDLLLPGVKGTEAVKQIKTMYPHVPLAVFSSISENNAKKSCISAGADVYIEKSASVDEISSVILGLFASKTQEKTTQALGEIKLSKRQKQLFGMLDKGLSAYSGDRDRSFW